MKRAFASLVFLLFALSATAQEWRALDYSKDSLWYETPAQGGCVADVFYVLPTCVWDWTDENGEVNHFADPYNEKQRGAMKYSYDLAQTIFAGEQCRFFAPYYRQISLNTWMESDSVITARFPYAMSDVHNSFNYFVEHLNDGRPIILAGFSQGARCVVELLKEMPEDVFQRVVAAYAIGCGVSQEDLDKYDNIRGATSATDLGVTICYNSMSSVANIRASLSASALCINPLNWCTDNTPADMNGAVVYVDEENKVLIVEGLNSEELHMPILEGLFKSGNYHLYELEFYKAALRQNVSDRVSAFLQ